MIWHLYDSYTTHGIIYNSMWLLVRSSPNCKILYVLPMNVTVENIWSRNRKGIIMKTLNLTPSQI